MRRTYRPKTPRLALQLAAVALAAATMGLLIVLPAQLETVTASAPDAMQQASAATVNVR